MPDAEHGSDRGSVGQLASSDRFPWLSLLQAFKLARDPRQIALAAVGILLTAGGWWLLAALFSGSAEPHTKQLTASYQVWPWLPPHRAALLTEARELRLPDAAYAPPTLDPPPVQAPPPSLDSQPILIPPPYAPERVFASGWPRLNPIAGGWSILSRPFIGLFHRGASITAFSFLLLCALWTAAVWALFGGAITRLAAVRLARDERVPIGQAVRHARVRWSGYFWAPLFPLIAALLPTLGLASVGWLMRFDAGLIVLGVLFPLLLVGGLLMVVLLLGLTVGWPLMWATISTEGTDTFDALSRTYAYVYQRPLSYLFYVVVAALVGLLSAILAWGIGIGVVYLTLWGASWSAGVAQTDRLAAEVSQWVSIVPEPAPPVVVDVYRSSEPGRIRMMGPPPPLSATGRFGARLIAVWIGLVELLVVAFNISFFWSSAAAIYMLLRKQVDATEPDEVYIEDEEERYGLPPLEKDEAGVPQAADVEPDAPPESN